MGWDGLGYSASRRTVRREAKKKIEGMRILYGEMEEQEEGRLRQSNGETITRPHEEEKSEGD